MKEYFLQIDILAFNSTVEKQRIVNETQFNQAIEPSIYAFSELRGVNWIFLSILNIITEIVGKMN